MPWEMRVGVFGLSQGILHHCHPGDAFVNRAFAPRQYFSNSAQSGTCPTSPRDIGGVDLEKFFLESEKDLEFIGLTTGIEVEYPHQQGCHFHGRKLSHPTLCQ
jgi:hypothetical protein